MEYKAVFFDRDGTLTRINEDLFKEREIYMAGLTGRKDFALTYELDVAMFRKVSVVCPELMQVDTFEKEKRFWKIWYRLILEEFEASGNLEELSEHLYDRYSYHKMLELYPETVEVLEYVKGRGFKISAVSNTFPSLERSLAALGISGYFDSFIASSVIGAEKPDPRIFTAALDSIGVSAEHSIFVDDYNVNTDGARELGFTSFFLNRGNLSFEPDKWTIGTLDHLIEFLR